MDMTKQDMPRVIGFNDKLYTTRRVIPWSLERPLLKQLEFIKNK